MKFMRMAALALLALGLSFHAQAAKYEEGVHYERITPPAPTTSGDKVEVLEVFWYGCPHCFRFEPFVERWLKRKPKNASFVRVPGIFRPSWEPHARAYFVAETLDVLDKVHKPLFDAIHVQRRNLNNEAQLADFFAEHGVDKKVFKDTYRSFAVEMRLNRTRDLVGRFDIDGVPAVIVNGKYRVSNRMTGGNANTLKVINYLVELESK